MTKHLEIHINLFWMFSWICYIKIKNLKKLNNEWLIFIKASILFASPETIKTLGEYRKIINEPQGDNSVLKYMDKLFLSMRKDLWVSNQSLKEFDILQTIIVGDIKKALDSK